MITFNQELAQNSDHTGGNYKSQIALVKLKAQWVDPKAGSEARSIEFTATNKEGQEFRYLNVYYTKRDGSQNEGGLGLINAMMGLLGIEKLNNNGGFVPEFHDKFVQLALQRVNYVKGDGSDGFKFDIKAVFDAKSGQTYPERQANREAESYAYWAGEFEKKPDGEQEKGRNASQSRPVQQGGVNAGAPPAGDDFDDTIPF